MILFGASGHCKVVLDTLKLMGLYPNLIYDDEPKIDYIYDIPVHKTSSNIENTEAIISIGNNKMRKEVSERYFLSYIKIIHPKSVISDYSQIGEGTVVFANAVINPNVEIGKHNIINTGAVVEHDCILGDFVHISPNAALAGNVKIGEGTHIGIGANIIQGIKVGKWVTIGAGSVVIKDIPDHTVVVGNPAKIIKLKK